MVIRTKRFHFFVLVKRYLILCNIVCSIQSKRQYPKGERCEKSRAKLSTFFSPNPIMERHFKRSDQSNCI